jgi:hypothetical protein
LTNFCADPRQTAGEFLEIGHFSSAVVGKTVRIRSLNIVGSARMLEGVRAKITGVHPIVKGWYTLELFENSITPYKQWTAPMEQLVLCND